MHIIIIIAINKITTVVEVVGVLKTVTVTIISDQGRICRKRRRAEAKIVIVKNVIEGKNRGTRRRSLKK